MIFLVVWCYFGDVDWIGLDEFLVDNVFVMLLDMNEFVDV